jgi:hypothetical protein
MFLAILILIQRVTPANRRNLQIEAQRADYIIKKPANRQ